jgi:3',5'-cyclic AMP phosphodiesterase CpdA
MPVRAVLLTDLHYSSEPNPALPERKGEIGRLILENAVAQVNRESRPDIVLVGGDLIDSPGACDSLALLEELKEVINGLEAPYLAVPGNHDPEPEEFYRIFPQNDFIEINGVRFVAFCDSEMPGYNARREEKEMRLMAETGKAFAGPLVSFQHVPVMPEGYGYKYYNYCNANEIIELMQETGYCLSVSGHLHCGQAPVVDRGVTYFAGKALCEQPFAYSIIDIFADGSVKIKEELVKLM